MKKSERIEAETGGPFEGPLAEHPCYTGWFDHFNAARYYEAHDVLEHLWLQTTGPNHTFFKGLIQLAGAFVHLKKQFEHPGHPKHGQRLKPAARLLRLAHTNLAPHTPKHLELNVQAVLNLAQDWHHRLSALAFASNPWSPATPPIVHLGVA